MEGSRFDLVVLGSGPAGQKAAIQAAKVGASVAVVERRDTIGGVCANTGTIPSKTLREAAIYLTGLSERGLYGQSYRVKEEITIEDLIWRTQQVMTREVDVIRNQLARNHIRVLPGQGRLADANHVEVSDMQGGLRTVAADRIVIATGTTPAHPAGVEFDEATILDSDGILLMSRIPSTLVVVGAGVIGIGVPLVARAGDLRRLVRGRAAAPFPIRAAVAFAAPASIISTVDQMLVNGGPLLVAAGGGRHATTSAGLVFAATMIVRAPVYVFQGVGASLLANLAHLNATAGSARMRAAVARIAAVMLGAGVVTVAMAVAIGPAALRILFGPTYIADRAQLAALGAGVGLYLAASTLSQALLAANRGGRASVAWLVSLGVFLAVYAGAGSASPLSRIGAAFLAAAVANLAALATAALVASRPSAGARG